MDVELPNIKNATSTDYWSLASNQYPSGKFPKVSVGITIPKARSVSRGRDSAASPAFERNLSQGTDGRSKSRPPKADSALLWPTQEAPDHDGSAKGEPEACHVKKVTVSQPDDNANEQTGTFSFGTRREQGSNPDKSETPEFVNSQGKGHLESANKPNREVLRMKLWEILGGVSQNKQAFASQNPDDTATHDQPNSQTARGPYSDNTKVFNSPVPDTIKTPDPLNHHFAKCKPSSDPIESDSDSPKVVETRPVTRSLGPKKVPAASKQQSRSAKKPLSTLRSTPKQKKVDIAVTINDKCTPKTVVKHAIGDSGSFITLRRSNRKAKADVQKIYYSDRIYDKTPQEEREGKLSSRNRPSENKGDKVTSISLSHTRKTAESCSRSPKRGRGPNQVSNVAPQKMQFPETLFSERQNDGLNKNSSERTSLTSKKSDPPSPQSKVNLNMPENSDTSPNAYAAADNNFNSPPSGAVNPSPQPKMHPWNHDSSPDINGKFGDKVNSPWAGRFRGIPDDFASPTLAANVNISCDVSKGIDCNLYASKYSKSMDKSKSSFLASDPESEPVDEVNKINELPVSESPESAEERENKKQPSLSALSPTEDEGAKSSNPSFGKGYKFQKWLSDMDGPKKSPLEHLGRKTNPKKDRMSKTCLSSPTPFDTSGTQETTISDKGHEQCPENYLTRAFDQLIVVLGRFQTKIKSETSKKSSEILAATGEIIRQHLDGVEMQMQADVDKLVNAGKSKRKRLESSLEEQQEKLRILHEKFKEEVNKQLQDCSNSLENFESYHAELKGAAEKQKSSHKKLLVNAEKTVGVQLSDAESKIAEVQKRARKRMNSLKYVLKELITETAD